MLLPREALAVETCSIDFSVPYNSAAYAHVMSMTENSDEFAACDTNYILNPGSPSSGFSPATQRGTTSGGGSYVTAVNVADDTLTYTPPANFAGTDTFTVWFCNDNIGCNVANNRLATVTVTVDPPTLSMTPAAGALTGGTVGVAYSAVTLTASGSTSPYAFTVSSGALPPGLSLGTVTSPTSTSSTVQLSGTPTAGGTYNFTIEAADSSTGTTPPDGKLRVSRAYSITIAAPTISVSPTTIPNGTQGTFYTQTLTANGGTAPRSFTVSAGALPTGLTLSTAGVLSGTPTQFGSFTFTAKAQDSSGGGGYFGTRQYTFSIATIKPVANAVSATVGYGSSANPITLNITGGVADSVAIGTQAAHGTATASGTSITYTPTAGYAGSDSFTYTATNIAGTSTAATVTIFVSWPTLTLNPLSLPEGFPGVAYSRTMTAGGGAAPYTYSIRNGTLPDGLSIDAGSGVISGIPTGVGVSSFEVGASDSTTGDGYFTIYQPYSITIRTPNPPVSGAVSATVAYNSANNPITLDITGGAPDSVAVATQASSGTATASGTSITYTPNAAYFGADSFTYTATNGDGTSAPATVTITVNPPPPVANAVSGTVAFNSSSNAITLSITGTAVTSVAVATGASNGTATASGTSITYTPTTGYFGSDSFTYTATNAGGTSAPATVSITVDPAAPVANAVSATVAANSTANPVTLNITGGPPASVAVATAAAHGTATASGTSITYTPTAGYSGSDSFTYTATNVTGTSAPATVSITVSPPTLTLSAIATTGEAATTLYSSTITASLGTAPYEFEVTSGELPDGLDLGLTTGEITGTPAAVGPFNFTVTATDVYGATGAQAYTITISAPVVAITSPGAGALPAATTGTAYSESFSASGGTGTHTFAASAGLPPGLSLSPSGELSGTPNLAGTYNFTVTPSDGTGPSLGGPFAGAAVSYSLTVTDPGIAISSPAAGALTAATTGTAYSQSFTATGGNGTHTFALAVGSSAPPGMSLSAVGMLSGTPNSAGSYSFDIIASDSTPVGDGGPFDSAAVTYTLEVSDPIVAISSPAAGALTAATTGTAYNQSFTATGGNGAHTFAFAVGSSAPSGMTLSTAGVLSGTPNSAGSYSFDIVASDSTPVGDGGPFESAAVTYTLEVSDPIVAINSPAAGALTAATTGTAYSQSFTATGGNGAHTFAFASGSSAPSGMTLSAAGVLSGTPNSAGSYSFDIVASDGTPVGDGGPFESAAVTYTLEVSDPIVAISSPAAGALTAATTGTAYSQSFTATGGNGTHTFAFAVGSSAPSGLTLSTAGVLSGTPNSAGSYSFDIVASDGTPSGDGGPFESAAVTYTLEVSDPIVAITGPASGALPTAATTGVAYSETFTASGGNGAHVFAFASGSSAPPGMTLSTAGVLSGTPNAAGNYSFDVIASDSTPSGDGGPFESAAVTYSLAVTDPTVTITDPAPGSSLNAYSSTVFNTSFAATGGQSPHKFTLTGTLPNGLTLTEAGVLSGTVAEAGTFNFTVTASDATPVGDGGPFSSSQASYSLTAHDDSPPEFDTFPEDITVEVDPPLTGSVVSWTQPTASDNIPGVTITQTTGLASGATFPLGATVNTYKARDVAGNETTNIFTVTVVQRPQGRVTMVVNTTVDGTFNFSSPEAPLNFAISTSSGNGTSGPIGVNPGTFAISFTVPDAFDVANATCSDGVSIIDPKTRSGSITVVSGASITCTLSASDISKTTGLIGQFLEARSQLILANGPDSSRRIERLTGNMSSQGGVSGFGLSFGGDILPFGVRISEREASFSYSLRRALAKDERQEEGALAIDGLYADGSGDAMPINPFDLWIEGKYARFNAAGGDGNFGIIHAGADYLVTPGVLLGLGGQLDWTDMEGEDDAEMDGIGYMIGPYLTARLSENFFFDARAAWGQSYNNVSPFGTYTDEVDATRWLISAALIGRFDLDRWSIQPKAEVAYFEEKSEDYEDSLGFDIPSVKAATGTFTFGPRVSTEVELNDFMRAEPFVTLEGTWTFSQENTATTVSESPGLEETGLRGRGELGFMLFGGGASSLSASGFYDGVGNSDFEAWGGEVQFKQEF